MVKASEIRDGDSLEAWLSGRSKDDAITLAQRAACRVLPLFGASMGEDWARSRDLTALPVLRASMNSGVGRHHTTREVRDAMYVAGVAADEATRAEDHVAGAAAKAAAAAAETADAHPTDTAEAASRAAKAANFAATYVADAEHCWEQVREDASLIEVGEDPLGRRLWSIPTPDWFRRADGTMRMIWSHDPPARWAFWTRWWDGVLSGRQVDWKLQFEVTLIDEDVWERGPDAVAEAILELEKRDVPDAAPRRSDDDPAQSHEAAMARNVRAIRLQLDTLRVFVEDEIERLRGANSLSSREHAALTLRLEMLAKIVEAVTLMREAFEEDAPGGNALVVVGAQLPAVVEAADNAVAGGGAPEVSAAIVSMATTIKYLTDAGMPGNYATGIAFGDMCWGKIKGWWTRK